MRLRFTLLFTLWVIFTNGQLLTTTPDFIKESDAVVAITVDGSKGNLGLNGFTGFAYVHTGVITNLSTGPSDWRYSKFTWGEANEAAKASGPSSNKWTYTINGGLRAFYNIVNPAEKILKIAILFRNANGSLVQRNTDGSDMYLPVYEAGLNVKFTVPVRQPNFQATPEPIVKNVGETIALTAKSSIDAELKFFYNGIQVGSTVASGTSISANPTIIAAGTQEIIVQAIAGGITKRDTVRFYIAPANVIAPVPAGLKDGINYSDDPTVVSLVLYAPFKNDVRVTGDFNNWSENQEYQMKKTPDGLRYWLTITGLTPGVEYSFQYIIDNSLRVADIYTEKVLDPWNDQYISPVTYPNLKPYPVGKTTGIVSIIQTGKPAYNWQVPNFNKPNKGNLVIYELLIRDFVATERWKTVKDSIPYLKRLGITAIELMPVNEFEGNNSWGYNPDFYFAPDKNYGTETDFKQFIDECHKNGIAVIMDIAMNHAFGLSPTVQMYFNSGTNKPAANNPWHNVDAKHPFNVGYDFNHESPDTKALVDRVVEHWLLNYKIDGFRWDLSKGFTQVNNLNNQSAWDSYDQSRITIWKRIYNKMQAVAPNSYCILEHFAYDSEEIELSNYGMLLWGNANHDYNEATMGYIPSSNFQRGIYTNRGWTAPNLVTYMESHDEERLMYRNREFGKVEVRALNTSLSRMGMAAAFWAMTPAPKMLWQFGELGYDYSINYCENGTISNDCRTSRKPIKWDYLLNANRKALYETYAKLLTLRKVPSYLPAFTSNSIGSSLDGSFKWLQVTTNALNICVIGNFDVVTKTGNVTFQKPGTWYPYIKGGLKYTGTATHTATGAPESFELAAGEYYVFLDRDPTSLLPVTYTFTGNGNWNNPANWSGNLLPPASLPPGFDIIIDPVINGACILNVPQTILPGATITVKEGKQFIVAGNLNYN
ncbi:MAG: alpha-amylase family glycosyl hydrolase [Bacteroidota bacterium]